MGFRRWLLADTPSFPFTFRTPPLLHPPPPDGVFGPRQAMFAQAPIIVDGQISVSALLLIVLKFMPVLAFGFVLPVSWNVFRFLCDLTHTYFA